MTLTPKKQVDLSTMKQSISDIRSGKSLGSMKPARALKIAETSYNTWLKSLNDEEKAFLANGYSESSVDHSAISKKADHSAVSPFYSEANALSQLLHNRDGYNLDSFKHVRDSEFKTSSYMGPASHPHYNKMQSGFIDELFYREGIRPEGAKLLEFSSLAQKYDDVAPKHGVPHITHHIWVGHQDADGNFKQPNDINQSVTLQTIDQFDASWKHYFWTNDVKSVPEAIKNDLRFEVKLLKDIENLALKDQIEMLAKNKFFGAAAGDVLRLSVLKEFGGVYLDMDYKVAKSLNDLANKYDFVSGYDSADGGYMGNAFIMACKEHPILASALERIERNLSDKAPEHITNPYTLFNWVIMATGPAAFTSAFFDAANKDGFKDLGLATKAVFDIELAVKASKGKVPAINNPEYANHLSPEAIGNDRFGGTWAVAETWDPCYLDAHRDKIFAGIYKPAGETTDHSHDLTA